MPDKTKVKYNIKGQMHEFIPKSTVGDGDCLYHSVAYLVIKYKLGTFPCGNGSGNGNEKS